jgi:hypothetical protein
MVVGHKRETGLVVMARHAAQPAARRAPVDSLALLVVAALALAATAIGLTVHQLSDHPSTPAASLAVTARPTGPCTRQVHVITSASFEPVLKQLAPQLASGPRCVALETTVADGQRAATVVAASPDADVWIPDDASWRNLPNDAKLAGTAGTVVATSPMYFVTQRGKVLTGAASSWVGLANELAQQSGTTLVVSDPAASGDGLVAAGSLGDAVFALSGPLPSALDLMRSWQKGRMIAPPAPAFPQSPNEVGLVPEYQLLRSGQAGQYNVVAPTDATAMMRFTWNPTAAAAGDGTRSAALTLLHDALTGTGAATLLATNDLRGPGGEPIASAGHEAAALPAQHGKSLATLSQHHLWHVLTTWHPEQRKANILVVVDISGSMADPAAGTHTSLISLVRQGVAQVAQLLPATSRVGLWQFGYQLAPPVDYQVLVPTAALDAGQKARFTSVAAALAARDTGTALYNTILAAYRDQQAHFQSGMPNEVLIFTDGKNEDAPNSVSLAQLKASLAAADPQKRVQVGVLAFRGQLPADDVTDALSPVGGQIDTLTTADDVLGAFVHAVSGGLTH